tara:strand:+ start:59 stop:256 length:198 start_codon:yes stop_codon:yes gene_type:complete
MKAQVLIEMPENELNDLLVTEKDRLVKMKMSHAVSPMENPLQIKFTRKTIARVMTEISKRRNTSK